MTPTLDLLQETFSHFKEGAKSVRAHTEEATYVIIPADAGLFWIYIEGGDFQKTKTASLDTYFKDVFGIEARY
jgi:hypothetical protein